MDPTNTFTVYDFIVLFSTLALSMGIGIFFACRSVSRAEHYFLADRRLSILPTTLSLVVTYQSSLMIIGVPAESYAYGLGFGYRVLGFIISYTFAAIFVIPVFHPLKITSVYKYFELRYRNNVIRYIAMSFGVFFLITYMGSVTFGICVALDVLVGIPYWGTILIYTTITAVYTSIGGMKAVIWTDVLQMIIMTTGVLAVVIKCTLQVGGFGNFYHIAPERFDMTDFRFDPTIRYQFWNVVFAPFCQHLIDSYSQPGIQRIRSMPTVKSARVTFIMAAVVKAFVSFTVCFEGIAIFGYYAYLQCDPIESGRISSSNELIPLTISDLFSSIPGLQGLFIAALSSAALSTLSSCLNSLGAVTYDDVIRVKYPNLPQKRATNLSKLFVFLYGIVAMCFSFLISALPGSILKVFYALTSCIDGPLCALFIMSTCTRMATSIGVLVGTIAGMVVTLTFNIGQMLLVDTRGTTLPPASINGCSNNFGFFGPLNTSFTNDSVATINLYTQSTPVMFGNSSSPSDVSYSDIFSATTPVPENDSSFFKSLFSISFMYFSLIGFTTSLIISFLVSLCTTPVENIDDEYIFSFKRHVLNKQAEKVELDKGKCNVDDDEFEESVLLGSDRRFPIKIS